MSSSQQAPNSSENRSRRVSPGQVVLFSAPLEGGGPSLVTLLRADCLADDLSAILARHQSLQGGGQRGWKVIGAASSAQRWAGLLEAAGEKVLKVVAREDCFEILHLPEEGRIQLSRPSLQAVEGEGQPRSQARRLKVLVVDDSSSIRGLLKKMVEADGDLEVVAAAERPSEVEALVEAHRPDLITLDIHMPEEDGVSLLKRLFPKYKIPIIMVTAIGLQEGRQVLDALGNGAVDYVQKPEFSEISALGSLLREKIRVAAKSRVRQAATRASVRSPVSSLDSSGLIVMGASTGGTEALKEVLLGLPKQIPPILIVQHIPPVFSKAFADRMNQLCPFEVLESEDGMEVKAGRVIVAAGGFQMGVRKIGPGLRICQDQQAALVNRHKPSVDYLFLSVKKATQGSQYKKVGVLLTGMGADGAAGLKELRQQGWRTIAQDEATSVVFGMPKEAIKLGAAEEILPLDQVSLRLSDWLKP